MCRIVKASHFVIAALPHVVPQLGYHVTTIAVKRLRRSDSLCAFAQFYEGP